MKGGEGGTVGLERWSCDAAQLREMTEEQRKLKSKLRTKKQRQRRRANSMQTHGKKGEALWRQGAEGGR